MNRDGNNAVPVAVHLIDPERRPNGSTCSVHVCALKPCIGIPTHEGHLECNLKGVLC